MLVHRMVTHSIKFAGTHIHFPISALESRLMSRWDVQKYAREAYDMGIRYIGACCGFEPYHVRAIAEEV